MRKSGSYYCDLVFALVRMRLPGESRERNWREIFKTQVHPNKAQHDVGIHVNALRLLFKHQKDNCPPKMIRCAGVVELNLIVRADRRVDKAAVIGSISTAVEHFFLDARGGIRRSIMAGPSTISRSTTTIATGHIAATSRSIETVTYVPPRCQQDSAVCRYQQQGVHHAPAGRHDGRGSRDRRTCAAGGVRLPLRQRAAHAGGRLSASLGVTAFRPEVVSPTQMVEEADIAMYEAKRNGRNRVAVFLGTLLV